MIWKNISEITEAPLSSLTLNYTSQCALHMKHAQHISCHTILTSREGREGKSSARIVCCWNQINSMEFMKERT